MERPNFRLPPPVKVSLPVGALMDIPTGEFLKGTHDQRVLNGGLSFITGYVGPANCFKTTIMRGLELIGLDRMFPVLQNPFFGSFDTELNSHESRNTALSQRFKNLAQVNLINDGIWQITDKAEYHGNQYFEELKTYLRGKRTEKNPKRYATAFLERDGVSPMTMLEPSFGDFDSLSKFSTEDVAAMLDKTEIGESAANTWQMRQGAGKYRLLEELPVLAVGAMHYVSFTAHVGKDIAIASGPGTPPPKKQLNGMPGDERIKGVSNNFFYLLHNCWYLNHARPFMTKDKTPEYPRIQGEEVEGDTDLNIVAMKQLRGKAGQSGFTINMLVSQREGVLPSLTEFHLLRTSDYYGLVGSDRNYHAALYPDVKLQRTTVRQKLNEDAKLRRAIEITSQLLQIYHWLPQYRETLMEPEALYTAIKEKGFDWDFILDQTRGYSLPDDEKAPMYPWSTLDLCRAARGEYFPYYLEADGKTIKKEYVK